MTDELRAAAECVVDEYDQTHLVHDVAYEDVAKSIDYLRAALAATPEPTEGREALWAKFTAGEKLAYGCGYRDARAEYITIDVERLARAIADHHDICSRMAIPECAADIAAEYARLASKDQS